MSKKPKQKSEASALSWRGFAASTDKTPRQSREEVEVSLERYGADGFVYGTDDAAGQAFVGFRVGNTRIRMVLPLPRREDSRTDAAHEQRVRARWRLFTLAVKARLEAISAGLETLETAFVADLVTASGRTVREIVGPGLAAAALTGAPFQLPAPELGEPPDPEPPRRPCLPVAPYRTTTPALTAALAVAAPDSKIAKLARDSKRVALPVSLAPPVPAAEVRVPEDRIVCAPMRATMSAGACMKFQAESAKRLELAQTPRRSPSAYEGIRPLQIPTCDGCSIGALVAARLGVPQRAAQEATPQWQRVEIHPDQTAEAAE